MFHTAVVCMISFLYVIWALNIPEHGNEEVKQKHIGDKKEDN